MRERNWSLSGEEPKEYEAVIKLGEETTTDDLTGEVVFRKPWEGVTPEMIHDVFRTFQGKIHQIPPMFSAVKVEGKPLYRLARKGIEIERKEREVEIFDLQIEEIDPSPGSLPSLLLEGNLYPQPWEGISEGRWDAVLTSFV